jgi:predicted porin
MRKKLIAVAVVSALAAPAVAQAQVTIGGGVNLLYFYTDPDNKSVGQATDVMQSSESELTIRAAEKMGGGVETWIQCGTSIDGILEGNAVTTAGMCTRNSAIGFRGGFGNVFFGNWDTPTKLVQNQIRGWFSGTNALYGGGYTLLGGGSSSGAANSSVAGGGSSGVSMYRRQARSVNYHSPNWGGFVLQAAYSAANEAANIPDTVTPVLTPRLAGVSGQFNLGGLWIGAAYESHTDYNPASLAAGYQGGTDDNMTLGVGYTFAGRFKLRASYSESKYEIGNVAAQELKAKGYNFYGEFNIAGPHSINVAYIAVLDPEGTSTVNVGRYKAPIVAGVANSATGATAYTLAYAYAFSKRTQGLIAYNVIDNDTRADFSQGVTASSLGGKQTTYGVAVRHSF